MSITVIPITPATLDIIEVLNDGVRPALKNEETFYVYRGKDEPAEITTHEGIEKIAEWWATVKILYLGQ